MNERIKELAKQAGAAYGDGYDFYLLEDHIEKFAELIVRECSDLVFSRDPRFEPAPHIYLLKVFGIKNEHN